MSCISQGKFQLTATYGSQEYHHRWFAQNMEGSVQLENISDRRNGFQIAGPKAAEVLQSCTSTVISEILGQRREAKILLEPLL